MTCACTCAGWRKPACSESRARAEVDGSMNDLSMYQKQAGDVHPACSSCSRPLESDEIALTKKLINRGAKKYYCLSCLSLRFEVPESVLQEKIVQFREMGCTLFSAGR